MPINYQSKLTYRCPKCSWVGVIKLAGDVFVHSEQCPKCRSNLKHKKSSLSESINPILRVRGMRLYIK